MPGLYFPKAVIDVIADHSAVTSRVRQAKKPALFLCNALGDHLLLRPTVLALQSLFGGRLGFIGLTGMANEFFADAAFRWESAIPFYPGPDDTHLFDPAEVIALRDEYDALISLNWWDSPEMNSLVSISDVPLILLSSNYGFVDSIGPAQNIVDYGFKLAQCFDSSLEVERFISLPPANVVTQARAQQIWSKLPSLNGYIAIHTETRPYKEWQVNCFRTFIHEFLARNPRMGVLVVDKADRGYDDGPHGERVICLDGVDLATSTLLLTKCDGFVGVDSYFLHVADFAGLPIVGLFGSTSPANWGPRVSPHLIIMRDPVAKIEVVDVLAAAFGLFSCRYERVNHISDLVSGNR